MQRRMRSCLHTPTQSSTFDLRSTCYEKSTKNQRKFFRRPSPTGRWIEDCGTSPPHNLRSSIFDPPATKNLRKINEKFFVNPPPQGGGSKIVGQHPHTIFELRSSIHLLRKFYETFFVDQPNPPVQNVKVTSTNCLQIVSSGL